MDDTSNIYDPALVQQLVGLSGIPDRQALMRQRMQYGREDSQAQTPQGMRVGGTYIAASPLEHIASALQRGMGLARQRRADTGIEQSIGQQEQGRSAMARALQRLFAAQGAAPAGPYTGEAPELIK